jgi:hypothetical protein
VRFRLEKDADTAAAEVRDRTARVRNRLPQTIDEPVIAKVEADAFPVIWLAFSSDTLDALQINDLVNRVVKPRLQTVTGVADVRIFGERKYAMLVLLDHARLSSYKLTPQDVQAIRATTGPAEVAAAPAVAPAAKGYQGILDSLPKVNAPTEKSLEQLFADRKAVEKMAGVSDDPYSEAKKRMAAMEERQAKENEGAGLDRLLAQMSAFAKADPSKGFGYAAAVSSDASRGLEKEQRALVEKQETAQIEFSKAVAKEEDARRHKDADGVLAAQQAQQEASLKYQKAEHDRGMLAAQIYQVQEQAGYHDKMANKPTREEFLAKLAKDDPETFRLIQGQGKAGVLTFEEALKSVNADKLNTGKSVDEKIRMAQELLDAQERLRKSGNAGNPAAPAAAVDNRSLWEKLTGPSQPAANTMPPGWTVQTNKP